MYKHATAKALRHHALNDVVVGLSTLLVSQSPWQWMAPSATVVIVPLKLVTCMNVVGTIKTARYINRAYNNNTRFWQCF